MVAFPAAVLCLCLSSTFVAGLPSTPQHPIAIARKPTALGRVERAVRSKERTLLKYQRNATLAKRQSTTLANPESDEFYVASVVVGNGQSVLVTLDTGSLSCAYVRLVRHLVSRSGLHLGRPGLPDGPSR
ncbi:hypothetical protein HDU91_001740, partial [Kappamyces sp. JEL0680]